MYAPSTPVPPRGAGSTLLRAIPLIALLVLAACGPARRQPGLPPSETPPEKTRTPEEVLAELSDWINPVKSSPVSLDVGDQLSVEVKGHAEYSLAGKVIPQDGLIELSGLSGESIQTIGKTPRALEKEIAKAYRAVLVSPYVTVNITKFATRVVYVSGEVRQSGKYSIPNDATLTLIRVLTEAGWLTEDADGSAVRILRDDPTSRVQATSPAIDLEVLLRAGRDIPLRANDSVQVPKRERFNVSIWGKGVANPGNYPWHEGLTITQLIALAGGLEKFADLEDVYVLRQGKSGQERILVDLNDVFDNEAPDLPLRPNDVIRIDDTFF